MAVLNFRISGTYDHEIEGSDEVDIRKCFPDDLTQDDSIDIQVDCFVNFLRAQGYDDLAIDNALQYGV